MVPIYNHAPFIERCLRSIINQTYAPAKLLVIDDGSTDGSAHVIERVLRDCPFDSELIVRENRGLCATLNQGFSLSFGKYFAYIGSDDYWLPTFIEERVKLLEPRENAVIGYGNAYFVNENDEVTVNTADFASTWANFVDGDVREMLARVIVPISSTVFYRRSALEGVAWNEGSRLEDYEMYLNLMNKGEFAYDPQTLSTWRDHSYNTSKDLCLMAREVLATQERNEDKFGFSPELLTKMQARTKFKYARDFLQFGFKREAIPLGIKSWRGAESVKQLAAFTVRLFVPMLVVDAKRKFSKKQVAGRYGKLEV